MQAGLLKVAEELPDATEVVQELLNFRVKIDPLTAHDSYGAWREGQHDDLVLATAVACRYGERQPGYGVWNLVIGTSLVPACYHTRTRFCARELC